MASLRRIGASALLLFAGAGGAAAGSSPPDLLDPDLDVRALPSLVVRWTCRCNPAAVTVGPAPGGGAVYVQSYRRFFALDVETHDVLWDHKLEEAHRPVGAPLLLEDRVGVVYGDRLFLVEPTSGVLVAEVELDGTVDDAVGPPLTLAVLRRSDPPGPPDGEILRIDEASGSVVARRGLRVLDLAAREGRLLALRLLPSARASDGGSAPEPERLIELSPDDLSTVRTWRGADDHFLPAPRGDRLLVPSEQTAEGTRHRWLAGLFDGDGDGGSPLPPRPRDGFHDLEAELQAELPAGSKVPAALRRLDPETGEVLWTVPLPHRLGAWLWDGGRLLVHTRPAEGGRGLLLTLDRDTGEVLEAAYGLAGVRSLARRGELVIAGAGQEVVAFESGERGPPEARVLPVAEEVERLLGRLEGRREPFVDRDTAGEVLALGPDALPILAARLPALAPHAALTVTRVLAEARYEPAAPRLAELLRTFPPPPEDAPPEWHNAHPKVEILAALGRIGGPPEVPAMGAVLLDPGEDFRVHERALTALAEIGSPVAVPWIDRFYASRGQDGPPEPPPEPTHPGEASPRGGSTPWSEADRIRLAVVRHFAAFRKHHVEGPFCVVAHRPLPWSHGGAGRPLRTVGPGEEAESSRSCFTIRPEPATEEETREYLGLRPELGPDERLWVLHVRSRHFAEAHWVVLRPVAGRWLVRTMTPWWVT